MLVVIFDQAVKFWVTNTLMGYDVVTFIPGVISLVNVPNYGAAFGILSGGNARIGFIVVTVIFCLAVIIALATNFINGRLARWSLVMVAAGGFANCIDRVMYGYVVDMFKVELFNFAIFNVADIFITVFAILFAIAILFEKDSTAEDEEEKPRRGKKAKFEDEYEEYKAKQRPGRPGSAPASAVSRPAPSRPAPSRSTAAARPGDRAQSAAPRAGASPARNADPFAEWEKANARVDAQRSGSYAARAMGAQQSPVQQPRSAAPGQQGGYRPPVQRSAQQQAPAQRPASQQAPYVQPAAAPQSAPAQAPAQRPAPQVKTEPAADSEFNLDDILNEFK